jgi:hypothetical protein
MCGCLSVSPDFVIALEIRIVGQGSGRTGEKKEEGEIKGEG